MKSSETMTQKEFLALHPIDHITAHTMETDRHVVTCMECGFSVRTNTPERFAGRVCGARKEREEE